ncbi:hypothetical protein [Carboxylicivirga linearis]|uniref:IPT/TIG domain-containing protein n=1 Tax=Carboxylicivirga linearis TaxID=1628157 RepID=A0ABS5JWR8_9BACT|nr:hypothetical protein [Carboxylicivirga linearis]MBS2099362.1 hypothetical protein [Carboxylicivirga linearis]
MKFTTILLALMYISVSGVFLVSCDKDDDENTSTEANVLSYGPMPVARGAELRFIGENLNKITSVVLPENIVISSANFTSHTETSIKLIVPQDAVEGYVKLTTEDDTLTTQTMLGFDEPISIEELSPASIKPGSVLTITGDYLNLVGEVIFAQNVSVDSTQFASQSRKELTLIVPAEAQSGTIALSNAADDPIIIYSEDELEVVIPTLSETTPNPVKPGEDLTFTGTDLDLVTSVTMGGEIVITKFVSQGTTALVVTVPTNTQNGAVKLLLPSGIEIEAGEITLVEPTAEIEDLQASYGIDETVVIGGADIDLFTTAAFTGADAVPVTLTEGKINLKVTAEAQSGPITLTTNNGTIVSVEGFVTTKPVATLPSSATPLDELTIESTLSNRVKMLLFGEVEAEATDAGDGFTVVVPLEAVSGNVTLVMDNDETVDLGSMSINAYTFCAVDEFAEETTSIGDLLRCTVVNGANLTDVKLNDVSTGYILNGNTLFVNVGYNTGIQKMTLVSSDATEVDYEVEVVGAGLVETVLYDIPLEVVGWGGATLPYIVEVPLPANAKIRIRVAQANSELQVMDGYWGMGPNWAITDDAKKNVIKFSPEELSKGYVDVDFSVFHDENDNPWWDGKIMFNADGVIVSSISMIIDYSAPTAIWEGSAEVIGWGTAFTTLTWGGYDFSGLKVGQTMYVYYTADSYATMRIGNGNWAALPSTIAIAKESGDTSDEGNITIPAGTSSISFKLTADDINSIQNNGGLGVYGGDFVVTKVALK